MRLARDAGFDERRHGADDGQPGVFATLDAGAPRTLGLYFMYDVKQADPAEWSSPPFEARDRRQARARQGRHRPRRRQPEGARRRRSSRRSHAIRGAGQKLPVNLVLVAEGEEEIGSPHFAQVVRRPEVSAALARCSGVFMPFAAQDPDGTVTVNLGAKGVVELELVVERREVGPRARARTCTRATARVSTARRSTWSRRSHARHARRRPRDRRLRRRRAQAHGRRERAPRHAAAARLDEATAKRMLSTPRWTHDVRGAQALERMAFAPTVNIEGLVAGYTGPGRQDHPAAPRGREARPAAGARHDVRRRGRGAARAPREARLRRHRGEPERRLRPDHDRRRRAARPRAARRLQARGPRPGAVAAPRRLVPGLRLHEPAAAAAGRATSASATAAARTRPTSTS